MPVAIDVFTVAAAVAVATVATVATAAAAGSVTSVTQHLARKATLGKHLRACAL